jgi:hypothetical protein
MAVRPLVAGPELDSAERLPSRWPAIQLGFLGHGWVEATTPAGWTDLSLAQVEFNSLYLRLVL